MKDIMKAERYLIAEDCGPKNLKPIRIVEGAYYANLLVDSLSADSPDRKFVTISLGSP